MDGRVKESSYIQCLNCGNIYTLECKIPIGVSIIKSECPICKHNKGLHCGHDEMDVLELKDWTLDERYFNYSRNNTKFMKDERF